MRREGSPWQGLGPVMLKELADHFSSARMRVLELLIVLTAGAAVFIAVGRVRELVAEDPFVLLKLFTVDRAPLPSFFLILGILIPLMAIGLGFDSINSEHNRRTMSRVLAQPIYRDALLAGKFLAALATIGVSLLSMWLLIVGLGVYVLGVPPSGEEIARSLLFLVVTLFYAGVWLALSMLLSIVFRSAATAALVALGLWLFLTLLWPMLVPTIAEWIAPPDIRYQMLGLQTPATYEWTTILLRLSPGTLFSEAVVALLNPQTRAVGPIYLEQLQGAVVGPLPLRESLLVAWPQAVGLIAGTIVLFVAGYIVFQRQEVRA